MVRVIICLVGVTFLCSCANNALIEAHNKMASLTDDSDVPESSISNQVEQNTQESKLLIVSYQPGSKENVMDYLNSEGYKVEHKYQNINAVIVKTTELELKSTKSKLLQAPNIIGVEENGVSFIN